MRQSQIQRQKQKDDLSGVSVTVENVILVASNVMSQLVLPFIPGAYLYAVKTILA